MLQQKWQLDASAPRQLQKAYTRTYQATLKSSSIARADKSFLPTRHAGTGGLTWITPSNLPVQQHQTYNLPLPQWPFLKLAQQTIIPLAATCLAEKDHTGLVSLLSSYAVRDNNGQS